MTSHSCSAKITTCVAMAPSPEGEQLTKLALPNAESHLIIKKWRLGEIEGELEALSSPRRANVADINELP